MKQKYILPVCATPVITSKPLTSLQCAVFEANDINNWFVNKFINIAAGRDMKVRYEHLQPEDWFEKEKVTDRYQMTLLADVLELKSFDIFKIIKNLISDGYYITGNFNSPCVRPNYAYSKLKYYPPYLIYGYDTKKQLFYAAGNTGKSRYETYTIKFSDYIDKIKGRDDGFFNLSFIKPDPCYEFKTNYPEIYNGVYDYINSTNQADGPVKEGKAKNCSYGLDCYRDFLDYITLTDDFHKYIEPLYCLVFLEHHRLMDRRLKYLSECGVIKDTAICGGYKKICEKSEVVYSDCESYNLTRDFRLLGKIYNTTEKIIADESEVLRSFLSELGSYLDNSK